MSKYKYTDEYLTVLVAQSFSIYEVMRKLDMKLAGGNHHHISKRIKSLMIDTSHFTGQGWSKGSVSPKKKAASEILVVRPEGSPRIKAERLVRCLLEIGRKYQCVLCDNEGLWRGLPLVLEVDHIDRNWLDNTPENLRFLCPSCHAQET